VHDLRSTGLVFPWWYGDLIVLKRCEFMFDAKTNCFAVVLAIRSVEGVCGAFARGNSDAGAVGHE